MDDHVSLEIPQITYGELRLIDAALARFESGEYGVCLGCNKRISAKRLGAVPWASHCIACEEQMHLASGREVLVERPA
jgi:RNA polymerase-binding transcription factor DksA